MTIKRALLLFALLIPAVSGHAQDKQDALPAPVQAMQERGIEIVDDFETPAGVRGYAGIAGGQPMAIYVVNEGQNAIVGIMIDGDGDPVNQDTLDELVAKPISERTWSQLENSTWVADGDEDAPRIIYEFSDPNCPYCHQFWEQSRPWVESGKVQIRHVLVGVISESSPYKAAAILAADDPEQAYLENENNFEDNGIQPLDEIPSAIRDQLVANQQLMHQLGIRGTPGIFYKDAEGRVHTQRGVPQGNALEEILGAS